MGTTRWFSGCPRPYFSLFDSAYGLVLHGHGRWSYRLMEVLNGEAIPVILADGWKLPLDTWLKMLEDGKSCLILKLLRTRLLVFFCLVGSVPFGAVSDVFFTRCPAKDELIDWEKISLLRSEKMACDPAALIETGPSLIDGSGGFRWDGYNISSFPEGEIQNHRIPQINRTNTRSI